MVKNQILLCLILLGICLVSFSQAPGKVKLSSLYINAGIGSGHNISPLGVSTTFVLSNNWGGSIRLMERLFDALPQKQQKYFSLVDPNDLLDIFSITVLREFKTKQKNVKFGLEAGPSWVRYRVAEYQGHTNFWGYDYYEVTYNPALESLGLFLRAKVNLNVARAVAFEFAAFGNINPYRSFAGLELSVNFGYLRAKRIKGKTK
jgi:hypothetical protein